LSRLETGRSFLFLQTFKRFCVMAGLARVLFMELHLRSINKPNVPYDEPKLFSQEWCPCTGDRTVY